MTTTSSSAFFSDPYRRQSPQRFVSRIPLEGAFISWRKHQKTHSSVSLNTAYGRRHSLESLSGGSLRNAAIGSRSLRWKFHPQQPMIEKLCNVAHFHYDLVELGPIKVELLPLIRDDGASSAERSYHCYHQQLQLASILPVLRENGAASAEESRDTSSGAGYSQDASKESNSRAGANVFHQQDDSAAGCITGETGTLPSAKIHYALRVHSNQQTWTIQRTYEDFVEFDKQLHRCVYDRRFSLLKELPARGATVLASGASSSGPLLHLPAADDPSTSTDETTWTALCRYMERFSDLAGSLITCFPVLKWLELDNRGNHLVTAEETQINIPAVAAAYVVQNYVATAVDELTLKVGDIVSVIDMPPASESIWWRGKLTILKTQYASGDIHQCEPPTASPGAHFVVRVGFFPSHCVQLFGNRFGRSLPGALQSGAVFTSRPVLRRRGKWATLLRFFLANRPSRRVLKEAGILKERVFGCDLAEHLESAGLDVPVVLRTCANVIESYGVVDGIYRGSGVLSNVQRLRNAFDENRVPNLLLQDIHCVASLLKMYFRELPNPLLTYQLYGSFICAVDGDESNVKILRLHSVVQQLPPPHFRTAEYLIKHLMRIGEHCHKTGMHFPNLALVWAPNLLRNKELENMEGNAGAMLRNVNTQAIVVEYLIRYADMIFSRKMPTFSSPESRITKHQPRPLSVECSSSLPSSPSRLMTLEEAKTKLIACQNEKVPSNVGLPDVSNRKCIDVNGGPSALPPMYHTVIHLPGSKSKAGKAATIGTNAGSWRTLFNGWLNAQECEDQRGKMLPDVSDPMPPSPTAKAPRPILPTDSRASHENIDDHTKRRRLWHARSAENVQMTASGTGRFISLDSSLREATARRSFKSTKRTSSKPNYSQLPPLPPHSFSPTPSPLGAAVSFAYSVQHSASESGRSSRVNSDGLKSCRTTDIDHALRAVVSVDAPPAIFSLRHEAGSQITLPLDGNSNVSYVEATLLPAPSTSISEPPLDHSRDETHWNEQLLRQKLVSVANSLYNGAGTSPMTSRKAFSAPCSLRRPEEKKRETAEFSYDRDADVPMFPMLLCSSRTGDAIDPLGEVVPEAPRTQPSPVSLDVEPADHVTLDVRPPQMPGIRGTATITKQMSSSEERLLLAQLRQTPPDDSPCQDELQNLFPGLNKIYSSLEHMPNVASVIDNEDDDEAKLLDMAMSITDLEVIEVNPEWIGPSEKDQFDGETQKDSGIGDCSVRVTKSRFENRTFENGSEKTVSLIESREADECIQQAILTPNVGQIPEKSLKDAATSPVPERIIMDVALAAGDPNRLPDGLASPHLLANGSRTCEEHLKSTSGDEATDKQEESSAMRFISFEEANAVFDRRETLQAVHSSRHDSEEDSLCLDSVYDNVISSPLNPTPREELKREKPTPKPRVSKLKPSSLAPTAVDSSNKSASGKGEESKENKRLSLGSSNQWPKQQRPSVLAVTSLEHKSSSEESELANSPLFRKQQQQLFSLAAPGVELERNQSEPPITDTLYDHSQRREESERKRQSMSAKSELLLRQTTNSADESSAGRQLIAPSPCSAFSPVLPKCNVPTDHELENRTREGSNNSAGSTRETLVPSRSNTQSRQQLHSILTTSKTHKSPHSKRKDAKVYFV